MSCSLKVAGTWTADQSKLSVHYLAKIVSLSKYCILKSFKVHQLIKGTTANVFMITLINISSVTKPIK